MAEEIPSPGSYEQFLESAKGATFKDQDPREAYAQMLAKHREAVAAEAGVTPETLHNMGREAIVEAIANTDPTRRYDPNFPIYQ